MSVNNSNKEQRKSFLTLIEDGDASWSLLGLVLLLAGASFVLISSIAPMTAAIAQEMTNNNTTRQAGSIGAQSSVCTPTSAGGIFDEGVTVGGTSAFDDYDADTEGDGNSATTSASGTNSTTIEEEGRNQSLSDARQHIEQACLILHSGDIEGALMQLHLALAALG